MGYRIVRVVVAAATATTMGVAATACTDDAGGSGRGPAAAPDLRLASSLQPIESCDGLGAWLRDEVAPRVTEYGLGPGGVVVMEDLDEAAGDAEMRAAPDAATATAADGSMAAAEPAPGGDAGYSGTNVQVAGVDEPDIVKTDGERILAVAGGRLHLVSIADGREVAALDLPADLGITDVLLAGDRALVVGTSWTAVPFAEDAPSGAIPDDRRQRPEIAPAAASTIVAEVDIAGASLILADTFSLDGMYVSARMTDDVVRLVLRTSPADGLPFVSPANGTEGAIDAAREHNRRVVEEAAPEDLLPRWRRLGADGAPTDEGALLGCDDVQAPNTFAGFAMVAVASIDLGDGLASGVTGAGATAVLATGDTVYASPDHLYVAAPAWVDPQPVEPGGDVAPEETQPGTDIHRFDLADPGRAVYDLSGHVDGTLLGQFALDEHDGHLRVATTTGFSWAGEGEDAPESESHVVVLAPAEGALTPVGDVGGLGPGEDIQSVRFIGDVGYVVTFERTDPLYTLDLSDPAAPRVAGELEIPGFSTYLHPVADGRLLGVGQDATAEGRTTGTQVSLFDVRDPAAPTRLAQVAFPGAGSTAESDHRAFLWWADAGLAAIPLSMCGAESFDGLVGLTVDPEAGTLTERGRVSHPGSPCGFGIDRPIPLPEPLPLPVEPGAGGGSGSSAGSLGSDRAVIAPGEPPPEGEVILPAPVQRALVIGDRLWTLSDQGMASSDIATLTDTVFVPFG